MNFWEARLEALKGKKVRKKGKLTVLSASDFQANFNWNNRDIDAEWEIVEEPKLSTTFHNVCKGYITSSCITIAEANRRNYVGNAGERLSIIEIITDENGKLISARNV